MKKVFLLVATIAFSCAIVDSAEANHIVVVKQTEVQKQVIEHPSLVMAITSSYESSVDVAVLNTASTPVDNDKPTSKDNEAPIMLATITPQLRINGPPVGITT